MELERVSKDYQKFQNGNKKITMSDLFKEIIRFGELNYNEETYIKIKKEYLELYKNDERLNFLKKTGFKQANGCRSCNGYLHIV